MLKIKFHKLDEVSDNEGGGGSPKTNETKTPSDQQNNSKAPEESGNIDEYGYEKQPAVDGGGEKKVEPKEETEKKTSEKKEEVTEPSSTGYGDKPPKVEENPPEEKKEVIKDETLGFELEVKDLETFEVDKIKKFIVDHKLTKEMAQAFVDFKKSEIAAQKQADEDYAKEIKLKIDKQKADWHKELKEDPKFGGENFVKSVARVEKVMSEFMPETKKILTERKTMLPPYVMRDFLRMSDHLFGTENLVQGDTKSEASKKVEKETSPLDFYE